MKTVLSFPVSVKASLHEEDENVRRALSRYVEDAIVQTAQREKARRDVIASRYVALELAKKLGEHGALGKVQVTLNRRDGHIVRHTMQK